MNKLSTVDWIALVLVLVGGLNWGLVGAFNFNLVTAIFGEASALSRIVFIVVGLATIYILLLSARLAKKPVATM